MKIIIMPATGTEFDIQADAIPTEKQQIQTAESINNQKTYRIKEVSWRLSNKKLTPVLHVVDVTTS